MASYISITTLMTEVKFKGKKLLKLSLKISPLLYQTLKSKAGKHNLTISGEINFQIQIFRESKDKAKYFIAYEEQCRRSLGKATKQISFYLLPSLEPYKDKINSVVIKKILSLNLSYTCLSLYKKYKKERKKVKRERKNLI